VITASAASALAGKYHAYTCRTPSGTAAPADGWSSEKKGAISFDYTENTCEKGGSLFGALSDKSTHPVEDEATWFLTVPSFAKTVGATLWRAGNGDGGEGSFNTYEYWIESPKFKIFDSCVYSFGCHEGKGNEEQPLAEANKVEVPSANLSSNIYAVASCVGSKGTECEGGKGDKNGYAAAIHIYAADIILEQTAGPSASNVSGPLATETPVHGISNLVFNATDPGAGVYQAVFTVDEKVVQSTVVNENGGHCKNVGQTKDGLAAFLYLQPCLQTVNGADVGFDTSQVSNGLHHLVVTVTDPAGNSATVLDREIEVSNKWAIQSTPNPSGAKGSHLVNTSCESASECMAVGYFTNSSGVVSTLAERWSSNEWADETTPNPSGAKESQLESVKCLSTTFCTAVGHYKNSSGVIVTLAESWNGTEWTIKTTPNPSGAKESYLTGVSCSISTACTAVGRYKNSSGVLVTLAERWNGTEWSIQTTPNPSGAKESQLNGLSCPNSAECIAAGEYTNSSGVVVTLAERWKSSEWTVQTTPNPSGAKASHLIQVSCTSGSACTAVGRYTNSSNVVVTLAERWNGTEWSVQSTPNPSGAKETRLRSVWCVSSVCVAVGDNINSSNVEEPLAVRWNATTWNIQPTPIPSGAKASNLRGVSCTSTVQCTAVGEYKNSSGVFETLAERYT
jgi:hypothetical protein